MLDEWLELPLLRRFDRRLDEHRIAADYFRVLNIAGLGDGYPDDDLSLKVLGDCFVWIDSFDRLNYFDFRRVSGCFFRGSGWWIRRGGLSGGLSEQ